MFNFEKQEKRLFNLHLASKQLHACILLIGHHVHNGWLECVLGIRGSLVDLTLNIAPRHNSQEDSNQESKAAGDHHECKKSQPSILRLPGPGQRKSCCNTHSHPQDHRV